MYYFDYITIALIFVALLNFLLGILLLFQLKKSSARAYSVVIVGVLFWIVSMIIFRATPAEISIYWCKILYVAATLTASTFLYFTYVFIKDWNYKKLIFFIPQFILILFTLFSNTIIKNVIVVPGQEKIIVFGSGYVLYVLYITSYFLLGFFNLIQKYIHSSGIQRIQAKYIFWGYFLAANFAMVTNLFLPWFGYFAFNWLGQVLSLFMVSFTVYSIVKHRLFDIHIRTQKILNTLIPIGVAITLTTAIAYTLYSHTTLNPAMIGVTLLFTYTVLYKILSYIFSQTPMSYILFRSVYRYQKALHHLAEEASTILDIDELARTIVTTITDEMRISKAAIFIASSKNNQAFEVLQSIEYEETDLQWFYHPSHHFLHAFTPKQQSFILEDVEYELQQEDMMYTRKKHLESIQHLLQKSHTAFVLGLRVRQTLMGFIVFGERSRNATYSMDDIELLERISSELAIALMNSRLHQEKTKLATLLQDEVQHAVEAWKQKSKENQELSEVRSQFISVASHQLRTPVSVVRNSLQLILEDYLCVEGNCDFNLSNEKAKHVILLLNNAFLASENLRNTTESILAASELVGSVPSLRIQQIPTLSFFEMRIKRAQLLLDAKSENHIHFDVSMQQEMQKNMVSDETRLGMVLDNVLCNAILYTIKGRVSCAVSMDNEHMVVCITDTGIGIPKKDQHKLFQRFIRLENAQRVVPDGSGLGLYLAKAYIELLRGSIVIESEEAKGTIVTIRFPLEYRYIATE
ncbi:MAG TPA: ATP-binding protein [Patescibacteria group bacterium]|nr:ATP-binding protein [Patescibacteria group bacterium]